METLIAKTFGTKLIILTGGKYKCDNKSKSRKINAERKTSFLQTLQ